MIKRTNKEFWESEDLKRQVELISGPVSWENFEKENDIHRAAIETPGIKNYLDSLESPVVAEIGCGIGRLVKVFSADRHAIGIDHSKAMLEQSKIYVPGADVRLTDGDKLPLEDSSVDFIYSFLVFQHIQTDAEIKQYIDESLRALKVGGFMRVQTHRGVYDPDGEFKGRFYPSLLEFCTAFARPNVKVVESCEGLLHSEWYWITIQKI